MKSSKLSGYKITPVRLSPEERDELRLLGKCEKFPEGCIARGIRILLSEFKKKKSPKK